MKLYTSGKSTILSDSEITIESFVRQVRNQDKDGIIEILSAGTGRNIPILRQFIYEVLSSNKINQEGFWFLVSILLDFDRRVYRKPITDAAISINEISSYKCPEALFDIIFTTILEDPDKVLDGLRFLRIFKNCIKEVHKSTLLDVAKNVNQPEGFSLLYDLLGLSTKEKIDFACDVASIPALYSLYLELAAAEEMYGIWHIQGLPNFPDRLNELPDSYEVQLIFDLIEKNVLHEEIEDSTGGLAIIEKEGFVAFAKMSTRHYAKAANRKNLQTISSYIGKNVTCRVIAKYERHYLMRTTGRFGMTGLLPIVLASQDTSIGDSIQCKVVSVVKNQKLLLLSQKPCKKTFAEGIPVLTVGEEYEAKFSLYNKRIVAEILGHGPIRANLISIPRNFDYKRHHLVRVTSSKLATCDIEIID